MGRRTFRGVSVDTVQNGVRLALVGDSRAASWPLPANLTNHRFMNRAVSDQTTVQILGRLEADVLSLKPDIVVLQAGINDLKAIPLFPERRDEIVRDCKKNLESIVSKCLEQQIRVVVTTVFPVGEPSLGRRPFWSSDVAIAVQDVNAFLLSLDMTNVVMLDSHALLSEKGGLLGDEYAIDTLHINAHGYNVLNKALTEILQQR